MDCNEFYRRRNVRTDTYLQHTWRPERLVRVSIGTDSAATDVGQHLLLSLVNLLARVHPRIIFSIPENGMPLRTFSVVRASTLEEAVFRTAKEIDPCGSFELSSTGGDITLGIGLDAESALDFYIGADHAIASLQRQPTQLVTAVPGSMRGAGLAACLGAAAAFKQELGLPVSPRSVSAWNYREDALAALGPTGLEPLQVGRVLLVGAGAVASGLIYWLRSWGVDGEWLVVDDDLVELNNTNRGLLFLPSDAGWPDGEARIKAESLAGFLPRARWVKAWYDEAGDVLEKPFDVVLALANDRDVRHHLAHRNAPVLLHATTGQNWLSQLHRHVAGYDDCVFCRVGEVQDVLFPCSTVDLSAGQRERVDAALPFLSAASGLMLATLLQRLQSGLLLEGVVNNWRWDFRSEHLMTTAGRSKCREGCGSWYPPSVRADINAGAAWAHLDGGTLGP